MEFCFVPYVWFDKIQKSINMCDRLNDAAASDIIWITSDNKTKQNNFNALMSDVPAPTKHF